MQVWRLLTAQKSFFFTATSVKPLRKHPWWSMCWSSLAMTCTVKINRILSKTYFTRFAMLAFATVYCLTVRWQQGLQIMNLPFWDWPLPELDLSDYSGQYRLLPSLLSQHSSTTNRHISMSYYLDGLCCSNRRSCETPLCVLKGTDECKKLLSPIIFG